MWNAGWDVIFRDREWGKYPPEELVRFIARNFYSTPDRKAVKILEVGCGPGANLWYLSREGFSVYGMDGSQVALEKARNRLAGEGLEVQLHCGDILSLPFPSDFFDCVIDIECLYANTAADTRRILEAIHRVLKSGGLFFSKTFMTGTYGDGLGVRVEGERNTFSELQEGAFHKGYGVVRFTDEQDIQTLYGERFAVQSVDHLIRSDQNRGHEVREWLIVCRKQAQVQRAVMPNSP